MSEFTYRGRRQERLSLPEKEKPTEDWPLWIRQIEEAARSGDVPAMANMILCTLGDTPVAEVSDKPSARDLEYLNQLCSLEVLKPYHQSIWETMVAMSDADWAHRGGWRHRDYFYTKLIDEYRWEID